MEPQIAIQNIPKLYPNARNVDVFFKNSGAGIQRRNTEFADGIVPMIQALVSPSELKTNHVNVGVSAGRLAHRDVLCLLQRFNGLFEVA